MIEQGLSHGGKSFPILRLLSLAETFLSLREKIGPEFGLLKCYLHCPV